jgi:hypothetical protein
MINSREQSVCFYLFMYSLFNDTFSVTHYMVWNERTIGEWWTVKDIEESGHGLILKHYPRIYLEVLRKITKNCHDSRYPKPDLNRVPPEYIAAVLTTQLRSSFQIFWEADTCSTDK